MVFKCDDQLDISNQDVISWCFDQPPPGLEPERPIYIDAVDTKRSYNHRQARTKIRQLVAGFRRLGLKKGDVVCVHSFNDINYPILVNGIVASGGIYAGTNPSYTPHELTHAVKAAGIKFFIVEPEILKNALQAADNAGISRSQILIFDNHEGQSAPAGFQSWKTLLDHGEEDWVRFGDLKTSSQTTIARMFSSGTTGLPKAAMLTHRNMIAQHCQINDRTPKPYVEKRIMATPMFHVATVPSTHFSPLRNGVQTYIMRRFDLEPYMRAVHTHRITDAATVPPIVLAIIKSDLKNKYSLRSIKFGTCGAAPLEKSTQAEFTKLLAPDVAFTQVYGMTETSCICTNFPFPERDTTGSVGRPVPGIEMKLVDDADRDVTAYDTRGEICVRGVTLINGYLDPKATEAAWDADGFFHTGDVGYCDRQSGKWYIVDRKKELIKVRGFQVAPPELEAVLLDHPGVQDAAVIGVRLSGDDTSEHPRAYIVRAKNAEGEGLDAEEVVRYMGEKLAKYKRPAGGVVFTERIPRNPSGKILKKVLREGAKEEMKKEKRSQGARL